MNRRDFFVVFPKVSAYENKDIDTQAYYDSIVSKWRDRIISNGYNLCVIHEDNLASRLLAGSEVKRYSVLRFTNRDYYALGETTPDNYIAEKNVYEVPEAIKAGTKGVKVNQEDVTSGNEQIYLMTLAQLRTKVASDYLVDQVPHILYIDANNNFCKKPKYSIGDGRMVCFVNVKNNTFSAFYGGVSISEDIVIQIMEANRNGDL